MSCQVPDEIKEYYYKEKRIVIIDISNLLYLSQGKDKLMKELIEVIQYNVHDIMPKPLVNSEIFKFESKEEAS